MDHHVDSFYVTDVMFLLRCRRCEAASGGGVEPAALGPESEEAVGTFDGGHALAACRPGMWTLTPGRACEKPCPFPIRMRRGDGKQWLCSAQKNI
jgi:hypothetical protein